MIDLKTLFTILIIVVSIVYLYKSFMLFSDVHAIRNILESKVNNPVADAEDGIHYATCPKCSTRIELSEEEFITGKYICPECAKQVEVV